MGHAAPSPAGETAARISIGPGRYCVGQIYTRNIVFTVFRGAVRSSAGQAVREKCKPGSDSKKDLFLGQYRVGTSHRWSPGWPSAVSSGLRGHIVVHDGPNQLQRLEIRESDPGERGTVLWPSPSLSRVTICIDATAGKPYGLPAVRIRLPLGD